MYGTEGESSTEVSLTVLCIFVKCIIVLFNAQNENKTSQPRKLLKVINFTDWD